MSILKAEFLNCQEISLSVLTARYWLLATRGPAISSRFTPPERSCFRYTQEQCQREVERSENGQNYEPT